MGRRGPLAGTEKRAAPTGIRFTPGLKAQITEAAAKAKRSFSEEVTIRLEKSFSTEGASIDFSSPETMALCMLIDLAVRDVNNNFGKEWFESRLSFVHAAAAIAEILNYFEPIGSIELPENAPLFEAMKASSTAEDVEKWRANITDPSNTAFGKRGAQLAVWALEVAARGADGETFERLRPVAAALNARLIAAQMDGVASRDLRREVSGLIVLPGTKS